MEEPGEADREGAKSGEHGDQEERRQDIHEVPVSAAPAFETRRAFRGCARHSS
jgi:hypothetical protein